MFPKGSPAITWSINTTFSTINLLSLGLNRMAQFRNANLHLREDQIAQVSSHDHVILQCLDITLGAIQFRLNDKHREKSPDTNRRGKRTIAKEKLYKHIQKRIQELYPNFNVGISTGTQGASINIWKHSYRHWLFVPKDVSIDSTKHKRKKE